MPPDRVAFRIARSGNTEKKNGIPAGRHDRIQETTGEGCDTKGVSGIDAVHAGLEEPLWQAASLAIQHNEELKVYYQKKRKEGKAHGTALGAVCRKLLVRIYVILKENRPYVVREPIPSALDS